MQLAFVDECMEAEDWYDYLNLHESHGSFAGDETIDFENTTRPLVINGATGSGKSTIIDAILFALTGDAVYKDKPHIIESTLAPVS